VPERRHSLVITHRMPLSDAAQGYDILLNREDKCGKVVLTPGAPSSVASGLNESETLKG